MPFGADFPNSKSPPVIFNISPRARNGYVYSAVLGSKVGK